MLTPLDAKYGLLQRLLAEGGPTLVCYSGGVDSALLLKVAVDVLGDGAVGLTAVSPSLAVEEREAAARLARQIGARQVEVETREMDDPGYVANSPRRCYFCKTALFVEARRQAEALGLRTIVYGANADDAHDFRPGAQAAAEFGVRGPLAEAGFTKADVRELSRRLGLPTAEKPAQPCLASRLPYGTEVTVERLRTIDRGESALRGLGFRELRVRHHGDVARLELPLADLPRLLDPDVREAVVAALREAGFRHVTVDLQGLRSGSLNEGVVRV
jgi:pyridinium-3,5-biscarboxylic acid mononucleotide sulfurtransferase